MFQHLTKRNARFHDLRREIVDFYVALVVDDEPFLVVEHDQRLRHVIVSCDDTPVARTHALERNGDGDGKTGQNSCTDTGIQPVQYDSVLGEFHRIPLPRLERGLFAESYFRNVNQRGVAPLFWRKRRGRPLTRPQG